MMEFHIQLHPVVFCILQEYSLEYRNIHCMPGAALGKTVVNQTDRKLPKGSFHPGGVTM